MNVNPPRISCPDCDQTYCTDHNDRVEIEADDKDRRQRAGDTRCETCKGDKRHCCVCFGTTTVDAATFALYERCRPLCVDVCISRQGHDEKDELHMWDEWLKRLERVRKSKNAAPDGWGEWLKHYPPPRTGKTVVVDGVRMPEPGPERDAFVAGVGAGGTLDAK